jgi:hypothetical protein
VKQTGQYVFKVKAKGAFAPSPALPQRASLTLSAQSQPGFAGADAMLGNCGEQVWSPTQTSPPPPYCKYTGKALKCVGL